MQLSDRIEKAIHTGLPDIDNFFDHLFEGQNKNVKRGFAPVSNVLEHENDYLLTVELPGVEPADVSVELADGRLTITGEKKADEIDEGAKVHRVERVHGKFARSFEFPIQVDFDKIEATSKNGVLSIRVPKSEKVLPRKIEIKATK